MFFSYYTTKTSRKWSDWFNSENMKTTKGTTLSCQLKVITATMPENYFQHLPFTTDTESSVVRRPNMNTGVTSINVFIVHSKMPLKVVHESGSLVFLCFRLYTASLTPILHWKRQRHVMLTLRRLTKNSINAKKKMLLPNLSVCKLSSIILLL